MNYLISPHDDDSALFAAFTCQREHPTVVVVADSYVQPARGEVGCSAQERAEETARAHEILGCPVIRLGLRDDNLTYLQVCEALEALPASDGGNIYTPALEAGHPQHDLVTHAVRTVYGPPGHGPDPLRCYSTYARRSDGVVNMQPVGTDEIRPTEAEADLKWRALSCYASQMRINWPHFAAVVGRSEWLSAYADPR